MKKLIPAVVAMLCITVLFSCRRVYTCTCSDGAKVKSVRTLDKQKKRDAQAECDAMSGTVVSGTTTVTMKCTL